MSRADARRANPLAHQEHGAARREGRDPHRRAAAGELLDSFRPRDRFPEAWRFDHRQGITLADDASIQRGGEERGLGLVDPLDDVAADPN